jgi:molybdopterin molybdotransferase
MDRRARASPRTRRAFALDRASGRVLAERVIATIDVPAFDRAAMDGYALHADETSGASDYNSLAFAVLGQALPGRPFDGAVPPASAVRIMTGAALPARADSVVPAEYAREASGQVEITLAVSPGKHIGRRGEDIRAGAAVLEPGRSLRPQDLGLLASLGIAEIAVVSEPRVRIIVTGNEVVSPGTPKGAHQIFDANSAMLRGLIARDGGVIESHHRLATTRPEYTMR